MMMIVWNANADMLERHQREAVERTGEIPETMTADMEIIEERTLAYRGRHVGVFVDSDAPVVGLIVPVVDDERAYRDHDERANLRDRLDRLEELLASHGVVLQ